jgi:RNA polymerase sigma-54 factor
MLRQSLQQKLLQKLSPQQIQFIKLLQVPTVSLDARIKEELEENPALEDMSLADMNEPMEDYPDKDPEDKISNEEQTNDNEEFNVEEYLQDDDISNYSNSGTFSHDDDEDRKEMPIAVQNSFLENLNNQLNLLDLTEKEFLIGQQIVGSLDDDGYLRRSTSSLIDDLAFSQNIIATEHEVEEILAKVQQFDPPGIAARDLQECLLIQLRKKNTDSYTVSKAIQILENHLEEFTRKHYDKLERILGINSDELKSIIDEILKLNPKPGDSGTSSGKTIHVIPDFHISNDEGILTLTLNARNAPELRISRSYQDMFQHYDQSAKTDKKMREAVQFVKQKLDSAKWFIDAIKQRQQTLLKTMNAIMHYQYDYFISGDERDLKPMILKDIADRVEMDISTVSRVANSKYVQTEFGTFLLKSFFSEAIQTDSGEEVSNKEVKKILEECIENEDKRKPLADEKLTEVLKEKGYTIARRTVAKYRESMNIPVARLRKQL